MTTPRFILPDHQSTREQHAMADYKCWSCGQPANRHCGQADPAPGDVLVCLNCTDPSVFDEAGIPQQPAPDMHAGIIADPEYRSFKSVIQAANRRALTRQAQEEAREVNEHG